MSEELLQRGLLENPEKIGKWDFYNIGATTVKGLKSYGIIKGINETKYDKRKPDGLIVYKGNVIAVISNKIPAKIEKHKDEDLKDWADVSKVLKAKILILTDGKQATYWINPLTGNLIQDEAGNILKVLFEPKNDEIPKLITHIIESISKKNDKIIEVELKDPTQLAKSVWQDIWSVSGDDAEVCLYTFVELFVFKYLSDLNVLTGSYTFEELLKKYEKDTEIQVLDYYATNIRREIKTLFKASEEDKTTIINGSTFINKEGEAVSGYSTVFKKVLEKFKTYEKEYGKFDHIHYEFKSKVFETFLKENISKKNWGQYFTPLKVVRAIVKMAKSDIRNDITVCDPACGVGKFLLEIIADNPNRFFPFEGDKMKRNISLIGYDKGFEDKEMKTIILAKANMLIYLSDLIRENSSSCDQFSALFNDTFKLQTRSILGTLLHPTKNTYDLILTNPPYVVDGSANYKEEISKTSLQDHYTISSLGIEGLFMEWIVKALKQEGKAFVIIPGGMLDRIPDKKLRKFIAEECFIDAIISLPNKTFFTTTKKTYILAITKKAKRTLIQKDPVFTYLVSDIGESLDKDRFDINSNHLDDAAGLFNQFKNDRHKFKSLDKRCKIQPCKYFVDTYDNWDIDRMWSTEEKIELGIEEKKNVLSVREYITQMTEYGEMLKKYENDLAILIKDKVKNNFKEISLLDKDVFKLTRGKRITKKTINHYRGDIPVFSSSMDKDSVMGYISADYLTKNKKVLFTTPSILFNIDGSVGYCFIKTEPKYTFIDVVASCQILVEGIDMEYLKIQLETEIALSGATYQSKLYFGKIKNYGIAIKIPLTSSGKFDISLQKEIAKKYQLINSIKEEIKTQTNYLVGAHISLT